MAGVDRTEATRALEQELGVLMRRLRQMMGERARLVHPEVNAAGYGMLMALQQQPQRASDLAELFLLDKGAVSRMVRAFEQLGFVERVPDPHDRRAQQLRLTPTAVERLEEVSEQRRSSFHERIESWSDGDLVALVDAVRRYNDALA